MSWYTILQLNETYYKEVELELKQPPGPIVYYHPDWPEAAVFTPPEFRKLRNLLKEYFNAPELLGESGKDLIFKGPKNSFTDVKFYDIMLMKLGEKREMKWFACKKYAHRVNAAICIGRSILWPRRLFDPGEIEMEKNRFDILAKNAKTPAEQKYYRKRGRKLSDTLDPYPACRRCSMLKKIEEESCLGKDFDPSDKECISCDSQLVCCHLMRLRIGRILKNREEEVIAELEARGEIKTIKQLTEEIMARRRKKVEEVTEEVIEEEEEEEEPTPKKKKKRKPVVEEEEEEEESTPKKKSKSQKAQAAEIKELLVELDEAREEKDNVAAGKIRQKLRKEYSYYLSKK